MTKDNQRLQVYRYPILSRFRSSSKWNGRRVLKNNVTLNILLTLIKPNTSSRARMKPLDQANARDPRLASLPLAQSLAMQRATTSPPSPPNERAHPRCKGKTYLFDSDNRIGARGAASPLLCPAPL